jgi:hypothetical protein
MSVNEKNDVINLLKDVAVEIYSIEGLEKS